MKRMKHIIFTSLLALSLSFSPISISPVTENIVTAEAATVKISKKKCTLTKGKSVTLKISGTDSEVKWSSSNKKVATVNSKGKVTAKKKGTAVITAKVGSDTYECKVTVKNPESASTDKTASSSTDKEFSYVLNTNSMKIHRPTCRHVKKISKKNYSTTNQSVDELKASNYTTCGTCF